jgi:hypothetical protein
MNIIQISSACVLCFRVMVGTLQQLRELDKAELASMKSRKNLRSIMEVNVAFAVLGWS